jgi:hypothetical protein
MHRQADNEMGHASSFCYCSTLDLAKFATALLKPGKLLDAESLREMQSTVVSLHTAGANYPGALMYATYGLGLQLGEYRGCRLVRHGGMNQSFNCFLGLFPDQQVAVVLQSNYMADDNALNTLFELYDELIKPSAPLRPPAPPEIAYAGAVELVGEYINPASGIQRISAANGHLVLNNHHPLICIAEGQYYYQSDTLRFPVAFPHSDTLIVRGTAYQRLTRTPFEANLDQWQAYAGVFIDPFTPYPDESAIEVRFDGVQVWINDIAQEALSNSLFVTSEGVFEFLGEDVLQVHMGTRYRRRR